MKSPKKHSQIDLLVLPSDHNLKALFNFSIKHVEYKSKQFENSEELMNFYQKKGGQLVLIDLSESKDETAPKKVKIGRISINRKKMSIKVDDNKIKCTPTEFMILDYLYRYKDSVVSKQDLVTYIWGKEGLETNTVNAHILNLRKKLGKASDIIITVRGFGYTISE
jgi:DNA-binding response OmpR family regulator